MRVKECMCNNVIYTNPGDTLENVAKLMNENHIGCIPVCEEAGNVVGFVTDRDIILRSVACDKDLKTTKASEIMTCNVCTCNENDEICDVEHKMSKNQIRRIPVVENNKVVGILTLGDLAQNTQEVGEKHVCDTIGNICDCGGQAKNDY